MGFIDLLRGNKPKQKSEEWTLGIKAPVYSSNQVAQLCFKDKIKDLSKLIGYSTYYLEKGIPHYAQLLQSVGKDMSHVKNWFSAFELYGKTQDIYYKSGAVTDIFINSAKWFNSFADSVFFSSRYVPITAATLALVHKLNVGATFLGSAKAAVEDGESLVKAATSSQKTLAMMKLAADISYLAFAVMSLACIAMGTTLATGVIIACLTTGTTLNLSSFLYEKLYDPKQSNTNVNFDAFKLRFQFASA